MTAVGKVTVQLEAAVLEDFARVKWTDVLEGFNWEGDDPHITEVIGLASEVCRAVWNQLNTPCIEQRAGEIAKALTEGSATASHDACVVVKREAMEMTMRFLKDVSEGTK
jgi:hypothetical protein